MNKTLNKLRACFRRARNKGQEVGKSAQTALNMQQAEGLQDKMADTTHLLEQIKHNRESNFLRGLTENSSVEKIGERIGEFALAANEDGLLYLYQWAVKIHGREKILPSLYTHLELSVLRVNCTKYLFQELQATGKNCPEFAVNWINSYFYELTASDLEFLLNFEDVAANVEPSVFMKLVVAQKYEKALLLFEYGARINTRCLPFVVAILNYDTGESQCITFKYDPKPSESDKRAGDVFLEIVKRFPDADKHIQKRLASLRFNSKIEHFRKQES